MRKPNLFLVGAPKAGSSLLWTMLKEHKDIFFSTNPEKEINYFSYDELIHNSSYKDYKVRSENDYLKVFKKGQSVKYLVDGSVSYFAYPLIPKKLYEFNSDAKIIVIVRDPVLRAFSHYNMDKRTRKLLKQEPVLGGYRAADYKSERIYATSRDGQKIPISLVYNKKVYKSPDKLLLYGYGSYGSTADPTFGSAKLSLLDRGFCYAIAHIRGGKIYDESWYEDGKMLNKMNTFNDFIDAGLYLIKKKYTTPAHLYAFGGSAGGLLMGVVANMSSDMFNGIIAAVPFVDVVNTMLDETIPLTTGEYDEWGNPNKKKYFDYMLSYSPYDNITNQDYANLFILSGYYDSQVQYWEPLKWIAKLREMRTNHNLLILDMDMDTGHGGSTGRFKPYKEAAKIYAFILMLEGITS